MRSTERRKAFEAILSVLALTAAFSAPATLPAQQDRSNIEAIREEALRSSSDRSGRPLPLVASWNTGKERTGFDWKLQRKLLESGSHVLPWFAQPTPHETNFDRDYYVDGLRWCAERQLPVTFISTQWERLLSVEKKYFDLPGDSNPNVVQTDGTVRRSVSPFGPVRPWTQVGADWAAAPNLKPLQRLYPDPPMVQFLSNNEHTKLRWTDVKSDRRYSRVIGSEPTQAETKQAIGDGWIERYKAMHKGFRQRLGPAWSQNAFFVGYSAFGQWAMARWAGWPAHSLYVPGRISPWPLAWDGASVPYYSNNWEAIADFFVYSPQIQAMNWVPMLEDALEANPDFWFELSVWDGQAPGKDNDKAAFYKKEGQKYDPDRYAGMVQFGMWLLRPRVVREFRGYLETYEDFGDYFNAVVAAVDRVHQKPELRDFWRHGRLVANESGRHPYQTIVPDEYENRSRWFLLETSVDPPQFKLYTHVPVFALALVKGNAPKREWLIYAHAPMGDRKNVEITVPGYGKAVGDVSVGGTFIRVKE